MMRDVERGFCVLFRRLHYTCAACSQVAGQAQHGYMVCAKDYDREIRSATRTCRREQLTLKLIDSKLTVKTLP